MSSNDESRSDSNGSEWRTSGYVDDVIKAIVKWQASEPDVVSKALGFATKPIALAVQWLVPPSAVQGALVASNWVAGLGLDHGTSENLRECDRLVTVQRIAYTTLAAGEGAVAGAAGIASLLVDIPLVVTGALRLIRQIGNLYDYRDDTDDERQFVFSVLAASGANSQHEKAQAIAMSSYLTNIISKQTWKSMSQKTFGAEVAIMSVKRVAKQVSINITKRKALAAIPVIGALVGGSANVWFFTEVGRAAQFQYQKRWLQDRDLFTYTESVSQ
jgi:hypothetical protein